MKLYENKVGRPSNEILKKRRNFSLVVTLGVLLLIGVSTLIITKLSTNDLKGAVSSPKPKVSLSTTSDVTEYKEYKATYKISNPTKNNIYYRWYTYKDTDYNGNPTFIQDFCSSVAKGKTITTSPSITLTKKQPERAGKMKVYSSKTTCLADSNGKSKDSKVFGTYPVTFKYKATTKQQISISVSATEEYNSYGTYPVVYTLNNTTGKTYYYRWFTYNTLNATGNPSHVEPICGSFKQQRITKPTLKLTQNTPNRSGKIKIYKTLASCNSDNKGVSSTNVVTSKTVNVKYVSVKKVYDKTIYVGDSRTAGMCNAVGTAGYEECSSNGKGGCDFSGTHRAKKFGNVTYITKPCAGYNNWFNDTTGKSVSKQNTGLYILNQELSSDSKRNVVINLGTNDLGDKNNAAKYASIYNDLKKKYPNINLVIVSVTEIVDKMAKEVAKSNATNQMVIDFNKVLKPNLSSDIKYCDVYSKIQNTFKSFDGIHYYNETYLSIYNEIQKCIKE